MNEQLKVVLEFIFHHIEIIALTLGIIGVISGLYSINKARKDSYKRLKEEREDLKAKVRNGF